MARFRYSALTQAGLARTGLIEAGSPEDAVRALAARGETATRLAPSKSGSAFTRIPRIELATFLGDLAALHDAGVPLRRALDVLSTEASSARAARLARLMAERLDAGSDFGRAADMEEAGDLALAAELARAGEASGRLGDALRFTAHLLRRQAEFSKRIGNALVYPAFLAALSIGAIVALSVFAGPAITPLLEDAPNPSTGLKAILSAGAFLSSYGLFVLLGLGVAILTTAHAARQAPARLTLARFRARLPVADRIVRDINCGAFARTLGALLSGGAPASTAMDLAARAAPNAFWRDRFMDAGRALRDGRTIAGVLASITGATPELVRLARVGEASGALGEMLGRAGDIGVDRALRRLDQAAAVAGPALILGMGGFTGWLMSTFLSGLSQLGEGSF